MEAANGQRVRSAIVRATTPLFSSSLHLIWPVHHHHHPLLRGDRSRSRSIAYRGLILYFVRYTRYTILSSFIGRHGDRAARLSPRGGCRTSKIEPLKPRGRPRRAVFAYQSGRS